MFLLINKHKGASSHDIIYSVRRATGEKKVGHAGTLDPSATGLLIVGVGRESTKKLGWIAKDTKKTYEAEIFLGEKRDTDDSEGKVISKQNSPKILSIGEVKKILKKFEGSQKQQPPIYSAIKIQGRKAYELARKGKEVILEKRNISIYSIKLLDYKFPTLSIRTTVSSGTYIRAIARDIGEVFGCGAYLKNLVRTRIGNYDIKNSIEVHKLTAENWKDFAIEID